MMRVSLGVAAMAIAACTTASSEEAALSEDAAARLAEFDRTGERRSCLPLRRINQITAIDDRNFLVRVGTNDYYLNELRSRCNGAARSFNRIQYTTSTGSLCRNEIITVVDNSTGFTVGSCGLSDFEKLEQIEDGGESGE